MDEHPEDEQALDELLTRPSRKLCESITEISSPLIVLGAGGKMGPSLCVLAKRAAEQAGTPLEVVAASRFSDESKRAWLEARGIATISIDLLDRHSLDQLPTARDVVYLAGMKFGTRADPSLTWAINTLAPAHAAEHFKAARITALSTGNVYPLVEVSGGGSIESDRPGPVGEYANAALARERLFEHFAGRPGGPRVALIRLNYATELRYGIPVDIANRISAGKAIDVTTGYFNCIWQGDANEMVLRSLPLATAPASRWNLTAPGVHSVRHAACKLGELLAREPAFLGEESATALLSNPAKICDTLDPPPTSFETILKRTAHWVAHGGAQLGKETHFEVRDGEF